MSIRRGLIYSFGQTGGQLFIQFFSAIIIARLLPPSELGVAAVALAVIAILEALREFGVGRYLVKEPDLTKDKVRTVFGLALIIGWLIAALLFLASQRVAMFYDEPRLSGIFVLLSVNFIILPIGLPAGGLMRRNRRYGELSVIVLSAAFAGTAVSILLAWRGLGPIALAWGEVARSSATVIMTLYFCRDHIRLGPSLKEWRAISGFGSLSTIESVISTLGSQLPQVLMGNVLGFAAVGFYSRSDRLAVMVQRLFLGSVNWVTGPELATKQRSGESITPMLMKATEFTLVIAWPALLFMAIEAHAIIALLFGTSWLGAAPVLQALCIAQLFQVIAGQANAVYLATGDIKLKLRNEVILQSIALSLLFLGMSHSVLLVAWLRVGFGLSHLLVHMSALRRYGEITFTDLGKALVRPLALAALFSIVLVGLRMAMPEPWRNHPVSVFPLAAVMLIVYLFFLMASRHPIVSEMSRVTRRK